jgi:glycosyltransferase involved in cell wall biosynthesis
MADIKVTTIMSVYNGANELKRTIESILTQSYENCEFIIIDDYSNDNTLDILNGYVRRDQRVKVLANSYNMGLTLSLNKGIKNSRGRYIARIDCGDIARVDRFEKQVAFLDAHSDYGVVGSAYCVVYPEFGTFNIVEPPFNDKIIRRNLMRRNFFAHSSLMIRKEVFDKVGYYDRDFRLSQDYDFLLRACSFFNLANLRDILVIRFQDLNSVSMKKWKRQEFYAAKAKYKNIRRGNLAANLKIIAIISLIENLARLCLPSKTKYLFKKHIMKQIPKELINADIDDYNIFFKYWADYHNLKR